MIDAILNKRISESHPDCAADCLSLTQYESVFPLHGEESKLDVPLNKFSIKYIFVFTDHLSIYKDTAQKIQNKISTPPKQSDFLNDYPIDSYLQPCRNGFSICFLQQYIDEVAKKRNATFKIIDDIKNTFGEMYPKKCIILQQELIQNGDQVQVICHQDLEEVTRLFF